ncbi:OmpH family outer membrane protein [Lentimicrobium sp.]|jgi:outer membrane protein|uniref:OmpH family outer membrane protein n=1 Tax=Lentimicrobium sp. TaxID=2034841 RepID=UPI0025E8DB87|nr:OmpH family outer membrane protein [Lentimicrobium sp.]MCO5256785.1 OmpH family outer membrane protein [Lentimicrobium sp.]MCO5261487.1 OmpH family outer membrane protein [Lentimicrobium sp.]HOP12812.1 OmpH family outer membrane protein [Lentimicrobium sp.]HPF63299.1 OmpH family outer membrane protein [Lentimicrobium sp.]HPR26416.1 OmpH family outer membrane protein [Lentimicrobium sp.]
MQEETMDQLPEIRESAPKSKLNIALTVVNLVMLAGLIVLYFIILGPRKGEPGNQALVQKSAQGGVTVAYVNSDSIMAHYDLVKSMRNTLETKTAALENELKRKQSSFEKDAAYFQEQVSKQTISEASAQEIYAQLMAEQQKLYELREQYSAELSRQEYELNLVLIDSLNNFLERYNRRMNFDYIFSHARGGNILTANDSLDITEEVLRQLNTEYTGNTSEK